MREGFREVKVEDSDHYNFSGWHYFHGREVSRIHFSDGGIIENDGKLICRVEGIAEGQNAWIAQIRDGQEIARHNVKHLESIHWVINKEEK